MNGSGEASKKLLSYMKEALIVCIRLKEYSEQNQEVFTGENDQAMIGVIRERESIINELISLEYKIDLILDAVDEYASGNALPDDVEAVRSRIHEVSRSVLDMDLQMMKRLSAKMQRYKDEALKARNKKSLSAYLRTNHLAQPLGSYDFKQ